MSTVPDRRPKPISGLAADTASGASQAGPPSAGSAPNRSRRAGDRAVPPWSRDPSQPAPTWWLESRAEIARQELERAEEPARAAKAGQKQVE